MHGWLILDKPYGMGSTQAVSFVKRALRVGGDSKAKVGHGGTLDPLASGVLPIAIGEATKLSGRMLGADKAYDFTIRFGVETDTLDAEGAVVAESAVRPTLTQVGAVLARFTGPIAQVPPAYSALKVEGKRAYDLARAGKEVALASRDVVIHRLEVRHPGLVPGSTHPWGSELESGLQEITLSALVSKGTYIRSLARDIASALGTFGHVAMLRRTRAGPFTLPQAISLDKLDEAAKDAALQALLLPLTAGLVDTPVLCLTPEQALAIRQGKKLFGIAAPPGLTLGVLGEIPVALIDVGDETRVVRGFNLVSE